MRIKSNILRENGLFESIRRRRIIVVAACFSLGALAIVAALTTNRVLAADKAPVQPDPIMVRQGDNLSIPSNSPLRNRVAVSDVGSSSDPHGLTFPGVVEADPARTVNVLPPLTGRLTALKAKLGDVVKQGQVLAIMSSPDLDQAYSDVDKARDALDFAKKALDRARGVHDAGANAVKDYEQANSNYEQALAEAKRADARLATLTEGSRASGARVLEIRAPISGTVTALNYGLGSFINDPTATLLTVGNLDTVWVTANLPEDKIAGVIPGQAASVELPSFPGQRFTGKIEFVNAVVEPDTHRIKVRIAFANRDGKLKPNMYADVKIDLPLGKQVVVPTSALLMNNDSTTVFVEVAPWTFARRVVELGQEDGERVRILSGLKGGERIIIKGGVLLND